MQLIMPNFCAFGCAVTHGHIDHVGALVSLRKEYPDVQVVYYQKEAPFLTGHRLLTFCISRAVAAVSLGASQMSQRPL